MQEHGQFTAEFRALTVDGSVRWMVARGRMVSDSRGEPVRLLGTIIDVTDARRQAEQRLSAMQRATAIAEVAAELANAAKMEELPEIVQRGAQVLGAESSALAVFEPDDGPLRLHMTNRLTDEIQVHVEYPVAGVEIELDETQPTQYAAMHGRAGAAGRPRRRHRPVPGRARGPRGAQHPRMAALPLRVEGRVLGAFVPLWSTDHPFAADDVEVLEALAAQIALSVSRLQADAERAAAVTAMREANQRLQLLAEAGRILSGTLDIDQQVRELAELVVPDLADWCWIVVTDEQGRLHDMASAHRDPSRREEVAALRAVDGRRDDRRGRRARGHRHRAADDRDDGRLGARGAGAPRPGVRGRRWPGSGVGSGTVVPLVARGQTLGALGLFNREERARSARPRSTPRSRSACGPAWRCTTRGCSASSATSPTRCSAACSPSRRSPTTRRSSSGTCRPRPGRRSAATGTTPSCSPTARTVVAIGDVVGHDTRAAAAMGQVRGLLRGIGYSSGGSPAEVLTELDRAIEGLALDTMATAAGRPPRAGRGGPAGGAGPAPLVERGPPAAGCCSTADGKARLLDESRPSCCSGSPRRPSGGST